jgi:hypothetical protein
VNLKRNFFQLATSWQGEIYFRISQNHNYSIPYIIKHKFTPEIRFLIIKYHQQLLNEKEEAEKLEREMKNYG